jgi:hypothetical protein
VDYIRFIASDMRIQIKELPQAKLTLIQTGGNLGFAGGSNVGIRYAMLDPACKYVWLLNNDTVVDAHALSAMVTHLDNKQLGMCGSVCLFYDKPDQIQLLGGPSLSKWTGRVFTTRGLRLDEAAAHVSTHRMDYVGGASWLIARKCLEDVGLLEESYFLYCEEADLAMRMRGKYAMGFTIESRIYHKGGASAGNSRDWSQRSITAEKFGARSRIMLARRFYRPYLPVTISAILLGAFYRLIRGPRRNGFVILSALWEGLLAPLHRPLVDSGNGTS